MFYLYHRNGDFFFLPLPSNVTIWICSSLLNPVCSAMYFASSDLAANVTGNPPWMWEFHFQPLYNSSEIHCNILIMQLQKNITMYDGHVLIRAQLSPTSCLKHGSCKPTGGAAPSPPYTVRMLVLIRYAVSYIVTRRQRNPFNKRLLSLRRRECVRIHESIGHPLTLGVCMVYSWGDFTQSWPVLSISEGAIVYSHSLSKSSCFYNAKAALYAT